jgi:hypothetical protein
LSLDYYELVNGTINNVSHKPNADYLSKLKNLSVEKDELFKKAKSNAQEAW